MAHFKNDEGSSKDLIAMRFVGISKENLDREIEDYFFGRGYKQVEGTLGNLTYEKGDRTMRILFGAFVKYFKYKIMTDELSDGEIGLRVIRATTGFSGGVIGRNQVTQEMIDIKSGLKTI